MFIEYKDELWNIDYVTSIVKTEYDETMGEKPFWGIRVWFEDESHRHITYKSQELRNSAWVVLKSKLPKALLI